MTRVIVTKGVHAGKTGSAEPAGAIGPIANRIFYVRVILDDGSGQAELPVDAIEIMPEQQS